MSIESADLAAAVALTSGRAAPQEIERLETVIDHIRRANLRAGLDDPPSLYLQGIIQKHHDHLTPELTSFLSECDVYGVRLPVADAIARRSGGRRQIIIFEGLLRVISYYAHTVTAVSHLMKRWGNETMVVAGQPLPIPLAFSAACFANLANFIAVGDDLADIACMLGPVSQQNIRFGVHGATMFVIAHEAGHLYLDHAGSTGRSSRPPSSLAMPQSLNEEQETELEADRYAFLGFREANRILFIPGVLFFLGPYAFMEAFNVGRSQGHPLAPNRAANIAGLLPDNEPDNGVVRGIIESQIEGILNLADRRAATGGDLRYRIGETMPLQLADQIIDLITSRVLAEFGPLEAAQNTP